MALSSPSRTRPGPFVVLAHSVGRFGFFPSSRSWLPIERMIFLKNWFSFVSPSLFCFVKETFRTHPERKYQVFTCTEYCSVWLMMRCILRVLKNSVSLCVKRENVFCACTLTIEAFPLQKSPPSPSFWFLLFEFHRMHK